MSVPVVDLSGLYSEKFEDRKAVADEIGKAIKDIGFLYIKGYDIPETTIEGLKSAAREFFAMSEDEKMNYYIGKSTHARGYVPEGEEIFQSNRPPDRKEAVSFGMELPETHPYVQRGIPLYGQNFDIASNPTFKKRVLDYINAVYDLARTLLRAFALILGIGEDGLDPYFQNPLATLRMLHYPYRPHLEDVPGIGAHEDFECLTILMCEAPGLELKVGDGDWLDVPPIPNTLVLNIGDMFEILSNGRMKPKTHRVRAVKEERYSFPFFFGGDYYTEMKPLPQFLAAGEKPNVESEAVMGDHVWSAFLQTYRYLTDKVRAGELEIPPGTKRRGIFAEQTSEAPAAAPQ